MIYLDNSATTRAFPSVAKAVSQQLTDSYFNISASYAPAMENERLFSSCCKTLSRLLSCGENEIVFTSGGTESDNTALFSFAHPQSEIIVSRGEHHAVLNAALRAKENGCNVIYAPLSANGTVEPEALSELVNDNTSFISIMHVNNETGAVNDIAALVKAAKRKNPNVIFHCDGVQAFMHIKTDMKTLGVDMYSISGHKLHAPKGIGVLFVRSGIKFKPFMYGGGQQRSLRPGTVNMPGIVGLEAALNEIGDYAEFSKKTERLKLMYAQRLLTLPDSRTVIPLNSSAPHILAISFKGLHAQTLQNALGSDVIISKGSACTSRSSKISHVFEAMNYPFDYADGTIRISLGAFNTESEVDEACGKIIDNINYARKFRRK